MRSKISRSSPWDVMVDLFFYRDPEDTETKTDDGAADDTSRADASAPEASENWVIDAPNWDSSAQGEWGAAPTGEWGSADAGAQGTWDQSITTPSWDAPPAQDF